MKHCPNYYIADAHRLAMLSDIAYGDEFEALDAAGALGAEDSVFVEVNETECVVAKFGDDVYLAFRGTEPTTFADLMTNIILAEFDDSSGPVHSGFLDSVCQIIGEIFTAVAELRGEDGFLYIGGHSKGGGEALVFADIVAGLNMETLPIAGVHVFGCPAVGGKEFAAGYQERLGSKTFRHVYRSDLVARSPILLRLIGRYRHVGKLVYHSPGGRSFAPSVWRYLVDGFRGISRRLALADHSTENYIRGTER